MMKLTYSATEYVTLDKEDYIAELLDDYNYLKRLVHSYMELDDEEIQDVTVYDEGSRGITLQVDYIHTVTNNQLDEAIRNMIKNYIDYNFSKHDDYTLEEAII